LAKAYIIVDLVDRVIYSRNYLNDRKVLIYVDNNKHKKITEE